MPTGHSAVLNGANGSANGPTDGNPQDPRVEGWRATLLSIFLKARKRSFYGDGRSVAAAGDITPSGVNGRVESFVIVDQIEVDRFEAMV